MKSASELSPHRQTEGKMSLFTSVREELSINVFKCLLIHHTTGTFLWETESFEQIKDENLLPLAVANRTFDVELD